MAQFQQWFEQDFTHKIEIRHCESVMFTGDDKGAVVGVRLYDNGAAYSGGGAVTGAVVRSDGGRVVLTGTLSGNAASVVIPGAALAYEGPIGVQIILTSGSQKTTVLKAVYNVDDTSGPAVDPGELVPDIDELLAEIETMRTATAAATAAAAAADNVDIDMVTGTNEATVTITRADGTTKSQTIRDVSYELKAALNHEFDGLNGIEQGLVQFTDTDTTYSDRRFGIRATSNGLISNSNYRCSICEAQKEGSFYVVEPATVGFSVAVYSGYPSSETYVQTYSDNTLPTQSNPLTIPRGYYFCINKNSANTVTWTCAFDGFILYDATPTSELIEEIKAGFYKVTPTWIENYYVNGGYIVGPVTPTSTAKYWINDYLYCHHCKQVRFVCTVRGTNQGYTFFDYDKKPVASGYNNGSRGDVLTVDVPDSAYYFVTSQRTNENETYTGTIDLIYNQQSLGAEDVASSNPILAGDKTGGMSRILHKIGFIGDSFSAGTAYYNENGQTYNAANPEWSWPSEMGRMINAETHAFASGGFTVRSWWSNYYNNADFLSNLCQAYYIGLGVNDRSTATLVPVGTPEDINLSDYTQNADTYYGGYAKIIQYIKACVPRAKIFIITNPRADDEYNTAVRYMATIFSNVYLIDLRTYGAGLFSTAHLGDMFINAHMTITGYQWVAGIMCAYTDYIIRNNVEKFNDISVTLQ